MEIWAYNLLALEVCQCMGNPPAPKCTNITTQEVHCRIRLVGMLLTGACDKCIFSVSAVLLSASCRQHTDNRKYWDPKCVHQAGAKQTLGNIDH